MTIESVLAIGIFALVIIVAILCGRDVKARLKIGAHEAEFGTTQTPNNYVGKGKKVRRKL